MSFCIVESCTPCVGPTAAGVDQIRRDAASDTSSCSGHLVILMRRRSSVTSDSGKLTWNERMAVLSGILAPLAFGSKGWGRRRRLEFPQVLTQRGARVLGAHGASLLEQRDHLLHEGFDVARPDALPDGKAVAPHRVDGARQLVGNARRGADVRPGVDA